MEKPTDYCQWGDHEAAYDLARRLPYEVIEEEEIKALESGELMLIPLKGLVLSRVSEAWKNYLISIGRSVDEANAKYREFILAASHPDKAIASQMMTGPFVQLARNA